MRDADLLNLQYGVSIYGPDKLIDNLMTRFGLWKFNRIFYSEYFVSLAEEFVEVLMVMILEVPDKEYLDDDYSIKKVIEKELIHLLIVEPRSFSQLYETASNCQPNDTIPSSVVLCH